MGIRCLLMPSLRLMLVISVNSVNFIVVILNFLWGGAGLQWPWLMTLSCNFSDCKSSRVTYDHRYCICSDLYRTFSEVITDATMKDTLCVCVLHSSADLQWSGLWRLSPLSALLCETSSCTVCSDLTYHCFHFTMLCVMLWPCDRVWMIVNHPQL